MSDAGTITPTEEELEEAPPKESREARTRKLTPKGLANSIETTVKNLGATWKRTSMVIKSVDETNDELSLQQILTKLSDCLKEYEEGWTVLETLFLSDSESEFKESYQTNNASFIDNVSMAEDAMTRVSTALAKLRAETRSVRSQKSNRSTSSRSQRSHRPVSSGSSIVSLRAKAAAEAAAAREKLRYTKEIATLKSKAAVKRAKEEAEFNAQLEILKAEQEAAETAARVEALSDLDEGSLTEKSPYNLTTPRDTANDHVQRFIQSLQTEPLPNFEPPKEQIQTPVDQLTGSAGDTARIIADAVTAAVNLKKITPPEPAVFTGDPLKYPDWRISFDSLIEERVAPAERIHYLKRYLGGGAKEAVGGYFLLKDPSAYQKAMMILEDRYGDPYMVAEPFREKLEAWPKIDPKNYDELRRFSDFLTQCSVAMKEMSSLDIMNDTREISKLLEKLPGWITNRWKRSAVTSKRVSGKYPGLRKLAEFMNTECDILCDPALRMTKETKKQTEHAVKPKTSYARSMATNAEKAFCISCEKPNHPLSECRKFGSKPKEEKEDFIKKNGLCYGCLGRGHRSKDCQNRATCDKCNLNHPTSLHRDKPVGEGTRSYQVPLDTTSRAVDTGNCGSISTCEMTSMIVPVWVSSQDHPSEEFLTYALLDTQSDSTFITSTVAGMLRAKPTKSALRLTTMTAGRKIVQCEKYTSLQIRRFDSNRRIKLPNAFTRESIPANRSHIGTNKTASSYPHLKPIAHLVPPLQDCGFGLLIGYNCSEALAPINYINGGDELPYAIETKLGWSIVGTHRGIQDEDEIGLSHRILVSELNPQLHHINNETSTHQYVMRTKVKELGPGDAIKALEGDFNQGELMDHPYSVEDQRFLDLQWNTIHVNAEDHVEMPLPFRSRPKLPNNRSMAMHRLNHLKKRLTKDERYYRHYKDFMGDIIKNGDAEEVSEKGETDRVCWYIPHHGVYHPNKPEKIRVVFDCSARFQNTSLNEHLLTGPDLTNNLVGVLCRFRQEDIAIMCDVERMFHQFHVNPEDRDYLRFLWWPNGDLNAEPSTYRMKVHLFGAGSSPGCANFGLKHIVDLYGKPDQQEAKKFIRRNFYVDDGLTSVAEVSTAITLIKDQCYCNMC